MISVRENVFESNSSSLHAITICEHVRDDEYVKKELERWKQEDGSYKISIVLDDDLVDAGSFTIRGYIPHPSLNDKMMYMFATLMQHYDGLLRSGPQEPTEPYKFIRNEKEREENFQKRKEDWKVEYKKWEAKGFHSSNKAILEAFEDHVKGLEEGLSEFFRGILFGDGPKWGWTDEAKEVWGPLTEDTRPKVTVKFEYKILNNDAIYPTNEDEWFSTGCYGNEEFYAALGGLCYWDVEEWLANPYNQILAGGDEQDNEDYVAQRKEAKRLLDESWEKYKANCQRDPDDDEDYRLIMNEGKVIFPIGG